jgi:hypothetical protein
MSYVLTIYSKEIYQDFILPAIDNADYTIVLQQKYFHFPMMFWSEWKLWTENGVLSRVKIIES